MHLLRQRSSFETLLFACASVAIALGIGFRFVQLNAPLFWQDEAYTALRVTGHFESDYLRMFDGRIRPVGDVRALEALDPTRGVPAVVRVLAAEDPHHSPLFYALDRVWIGAFGTSPAGFRGLSAALGTFGIGLTFVLAATLLRSRLGGAITAALFAVSPIFVLYSRQAREYALFMNALALGTLALVRAVRSPSRGAWLVYAATVALGLYVDPIFSLVVVAHGIAVLLLARPRAAGIVSWLAASALGGACFVPWALNAYRSSANIEGQLDWGRTAYPFKYLAMKWAFNIGALAFDAEFRALSLVPIAIFVVLAVALGVWLFVARAKRDVVAFVVPLAATTLIVFVGRDLFFDSHFSTIVRYLTPLWFGLILACGAVITRGLRVPRLRALALAIWLAALGSGTYSALARGGAENWWDNNDQIAFQDMARTINRLPHPLVITQFRPHVPLVMARYLRADAEFLTFDSTVPPIPPGRHAFLITPSRDVREALAARTRGHYRIENVSPKKTTIIEGFHRNLDRAAPELIRGNNPIFVPENALWALLPVAQAK